MAVFFWKGTALAQGALNSTATGESIPTFALIKVLFQ